MTKPNSALQAGGDETPVARILPRPGSPEASAMMDTLLAEYNWPSNTKNCARAGWEAAHRWLSTRPTPAAAAGVPDEQKSDQRLASERIDAAYDEWVKRIDKRQPSGRAGFHQGAAWMANVLAPHVAQPSATTARYVAAAPRLASALRELFKRLDNLQDQATVSDASAMLMHLAAASPVAPAGVPTDAEIDALAEQMPGGLDGFLKGWGWRQFGRALLERFAHRVAPISINDAYEAGWFSAARWAKREDLFADTDSAAYVRDRDAELAGYAVLSAGAPAVPQPDSVHSHLAVPGSTVPSAASRGQAVGDGDIAPTLPEQPQPVASAKNFRRMPTAAMVEAGRKAMCPEKFVSHARTIWVWLAMHDAAPANPDEALDYVSDVTEQDASRWQMLPAVLEEFQIDYIELLTRIDALRAVPHQPTGERE